MPESISHYDVRLMPDPMTGPVLNGVAECIEHREVDEFGEPGRVLQSTLKCVRLQHGEQLVPDCGALVRCGYRYNVQSVERRGRPRWLHDVDE